MLVRENKKYYKEEIGQRGGKIKKKKVKMRTEQKKNRKIRRKGSEQGRKEKMGSR